MHTGGGGPLGIVDRGMFKGIKKLKYISNKVKKNHKQTLCSVTSKW